jgi:hypothetical protein
MTSLVELVVRTVTECQRHQIEGGWECHHCGSLWSDMLMGIGWLPLSCPERARAASEDRSNG